MRTKSGTACMALGLLLLLTAGALTGYNIWDSNRAGQSAGAAFQALRTSIAETIEAELPEEILPTYQIDPRVEMPVAEIDGIGYVGTISFPSLDLELPVLDEWSYPNLKIGPCRYYGSAYLNNMVIAAHNYRRHFGPLSRLNVGDQVQLTDMDGNVFAYSVAAMEQLRPNQTWEMVTAGDYDLTLFTCTIGGRQRLTVRCVQEENAPA